MQLASLSRPLNQDGCCGDVTAFWQEGDRTLLLIADGLGHGHAAAKASQAAVDYVAAHRDLPLSKLLHGCDAALFETRGAAVAIAVVDKGAQQLSYVGVGNTRCAVVGESTTRLHSKPGVIGGGSARVVVESVRLDSGDVIVLWTDGLSESIDLSFIHSLSNPNKPQGWTWVAKYLLDEYYPGSDDVAVLVCGPTIGD